jgi:hypothetical protein
MTPAFSAGIFFCLLIYSTPALAYIGLGPLLPVLGSFLIYLFVVLMAMIGILGYPIKRLLDRLKRKKMGSDDVFVGDGTPTALMVDNKSRSDLEVISAFFLNHLSSLETSILRRRLSATVSQPIFVCGLARSNTTLLTHILNSHTDTGSFLYRDLPFPSIPYFWSFFNTSYYRGKSLEQRIHRDALRVDPNSPDAFEEIIWKKRLVDYTEGGFCRPLDRTYENSALMQSLTDSIRKILFIRGRKTRYLSKGNYNLFRLKFLLETFPDARIVLCIRNPIQQAMSMARVHGEFSRLAANDRLFGGKLDSLGHFEFGPNRKPVTVNSDGCMRTEAFWAQGDDYRGYLQQWIDVYSFVRDHYFLDDEIKCQILLVNYGRFVADPTSEIRRIADFCHLETTESYLRETADRVSSSPAYTARLDSGDQEDQAIKLYNDILSLV